MSCSVLRVRFARGDTHMLLGVVWLVWCGILSALYLGERGARRTTPRLVRYPGAGGPPTVNSRRAVASHCCRGAVARVLHRGERVETETSLLLGRSW
jgi:hypothetical protein